MRWRDPAHLLAFGFGTGLVPHAPGTAGSAAGTVAYDLALAPAALWVQVLVVGIAFLIGVAACARVERELTTHDHRAIVWDEVVGVWVTLLASGGTWLGALAGFALFRLFDIWKPWPISWVDRRVPGGLGVMLDDVAAGVVGAAALLVARALVPGPPIG